MDSDEFGKLIDAHSPALQLFAAQWSSHPADVVQEVFLELFRRSHVPPDIKPWLFRAVRNRAINSLRSDTRRRKYEAQKAAAVEPWFQSQTDSTLDASDAEAALRELPDREREVIVARIWGDLTFDEVAELIGASSSSAHRLFERGIRSLQQRFNRHAR